MAEWSLTYEYQQHKAKDRVKQRGVHVARSISCLDSATTFFGLPPARFIWDCGGPEGSCRGSRYRQDDHRRGKEAKACAHQALRGAMVKKGVLSVCLSTRSRCGRATILGKMMRVSAVPVGHWIQLRLRNNATLFVDTYP